MRTLLLLLLTACSCYGQAFNLRDPAFVGQQQPPATAGYTAYATTFPTSAYLTHTNNFTGLVNGKTGTLSFWIKTKTTAETYRILNNIGGGANNQNFYKDTSGHLRIILNNYFTGDPALDMNSTANIDDGGWHHILAAWDTTDSAKCVIYTDGTRGVTTNTVISTYNLDYAGSTVWHFSDASTFQLNADISEFWLGLNQYTTNVSSFRSGTGHPVSLGVNGSTPTGSAPTIYFKDPYNTFPNNSGTGGNFALSAGSLSSAVAP